MTIYMIMTDAIRQAELSIRPLEKDETCSVHMRATTGEVVISRGRTDRPVPPSDRIYGFDDTLNQ